MCLRRVCLRLRWRWSIKPNQMNFLSLIQSRFKQQKPAQPQLAPGLYHYTRQAEYERARIHLRIDPDGSGLLLVNANRVVHLNPSAAFMAHLALEDTLPSAAIQAITRRYQVPESQAREDYTQLQYQIHELVRPDGACPVHDLDIETVMPFSARPSAPYRMDLALTYRCNNDCAHCYNDRPRTFPEMKVDQWKQVLDTLWSLGIPHVVFTGGEPTLVDSLPELIAHAEHNGQITGLNTNARRLSNKAFLQRLVDAGLDHIQITVESHLPEVHDRMVRARGAWNQTIAGLRNALDTPLYLMTNTTMLQENSPSSKIPSIFWASLAYPPSG